MRRYGPRSPAHDLRHVHITESVTAKVSRGITSDRLGVLALFVGLLLGVWALAGLLWAVISVAQRLQPTRHLLMDGMHRITGQ